MNCVMEMSKVMRIPAQVVLRCAKSQNRRLVSDKKLVVITVVERVILRPSNPVIIGIYREVLRLHSLPNEHRIAAARQPIVPKMHIEIVSDDLRSQRRHGVMTFFLFAHVALLDAPEKPRGAGKKLISRLLERKRNYDVKFSNSTRLRR